MSDVCESLPTFALKYTMNTFISNERMVSYALSSVELGIRTEYAESTVYSEPSHRFIQNLGLPLTAKPLQTYY